MGGRSTFSPVHYVSSQFTEGVTRARWAGTSCRPQDQIILQRLELGRHRCRNRKRQDECGGRSFLQCACPALRAPRPSNCFGRRASSSSQQARLCITASFVFSHFNLLRRRKMLADSTKLLARHAVSRLSASPRLVHRRTYISSSYFLSSTPRHASRARSTQAQWHCLTQTRGARRKATIDLEDIPQGAIDGPPLPPQVDEPEYPPLLQQVRNNLIKFSHCVLLTRVGGFYEVSIIPCDSA